MGGHHTQTITRNNTAEPPSWAAGFYKKLADDARNRYNQGVDGKVPDLSDTTKSALGNINTQAGQYNDYLNNLLHTQPNSAQNLGNIAQGGQIGHNAAFQSALQDSLNKTADTINSQFSGAGRYGSGANNAVMANSLGQVATTATAQQYNQDIANMLNANKQIDNANSQHITDINNTMQGKADSIRQQLLGGRLLDQHNQDVNNAGINNMLKYGNLLNGLAGRYGSSTQTDTQTNNRSALQNILSAGGIGAGLLGRLK